DLRQLERSWAAQNPVRESESRPPVGTSALPRPPSPPSFGAAAKYRPESRTTAHASPRSSHRSSPSNREWAWWADSASRTASARHHRKKHKFHFPCPRKAGPCASCLL